MVVQDVKSRTAMVRMQAELCHMQSEVVRLTAEVCTARKMETFGRCAVAAVHDVNNLLGVIIALIEVSRELNPTSILSKNLNEMDMAARRSADLLRHLLASSKQQMRRDKDLDLNVVIEGMTDILQRTIGEKIRLLYTPVIPLGRIQVDSEQIEQIMMNLVVNARDAMPHGGEINIKTSVVQLDKGCGDLSTNSCPGEYVMLSVADTGQGMKEEVRCEIFKPFFTTKAPGRGTGLGLSIVSALVQQNQGYIRVYSKPGRGTTFELYFPRLCETTLS